MPNLDDDNKYRDELSKHFLYSLFFPKSIAVVGARLSVNWGISIYLDAYKKYGYGVKRDPKIYPVNPKHEGKVFWDMWTCYKDVKSIPERVDIVLCAIRANLTPDLLRECIEAKARFMVIYTSGFSEVGKRGMKYSEEIKKILEEDKTTRVIGPNCFGPLNSQIDLNFNMTIDRLHTGAHPGFSFFTQSGGFAHRTIEYAEKRGLGINLGVSVGNMIDLDMNDFINFFELDPKTRVIGFYLESVQTREKGRKFLENLERVSEKKPVIIFKGGRTEIGAIECRSHTGAMAGAQEIYDGAFKQVNVIAVKNAQEFFDMSHFLTNLTYSGFPKGRRTCTVVPGGGMSVEMADMFSASGLTFPAISEEAQLSLTKFLNDVNTIFRNPIDIGALGHMPEYLLDSMKIALKEDQIDIGIPVLFLSRLTTGYYPGDFTPSFGRSLARIKKKTGKTIVVIPIVDREDKNTIWQYQGLRKFLDKYGIPHFPSTNRLARSMKYLLQYLDRKRERKKHFSQVSAP
ncbi:MAG: CoA-binding protein [Candidatus Helarchaeota archaeon]